MQTPSCRILAAALLGLAGPALAQKPSVAPAGASPRLGSAAPATVPLFNRTALEAPNRQAVVAEDLVFRATFKVEKPGPSLSGREITFTLGGAAACKATSDAQGLATCHFKIPPMPQGFHTYRASFEGAGGLSSAKVEAKLLVGKAQTKLKVVTAGALNQELAPGDTVSVGAQLTRLLDDSPMDGKPIAFSVNGAPIGTETSVMGTAWKKWTVPSNAAGSQKFEAFFVTDDFYVGTSASLTKSVARKAYLHVLSTPGGVVGKAITVKGTISRIPPAAEALTPVSGGLPGRKLEFIFDGYDPATNAVKPLWSWTAVTDGSGVATVTKVPEANASRIRLRLEPPTDGWDADEVARQFAVATSSTRVTAPAASGRIGTNVTLRLHLARETDGAPRKFARLRVTKFDSSALANPIVFQTDANGDGSTSVPVTSQMGIGSHTLTIAVDGDGACKPATATVALQVQPSA